MVSEIFALASEKKPAIVECIVNPLTEKVIQVDSQLVHQTSVVFGNYGITGEVGRVCIKSDRTGSADRTGSVQIELEVYWTIKGVSPLFLRGKGLTS